MSCINESKVAQRRFEAASAPFLIAAHAGPYHTVACLLREVLDIHGLS